jgi:seryl-tRNA synthetase
VNAPGRVQEALNIMQRNGAYNNYSSAAAETTQPANYVQQGSTRPVNANPTVQQRNVPPQASPPPPPVQGHPVQGSSQTADKLQELQTQLQATRKQLQDAQAQLQAAKQREAQLQAAKQHEVQVQEAQKQLQDMQSQLQATLAELRATQARIGDANS